MKSTRRVLLAMVLILAVGSVVPCQATEQGKSSRKFNKKSALAYLDWLANNPDAQVPGDKSQVWIRESVSLLVKKTGHYPDAVQVVGETWIVTGDLKEDIAKWKQRVGNHTSGISGDGDSTSALERRSHPSQPLADEPSSVSLSPAERAYKRCMDDGNTPGYCYWWAYRVK